jgi:hypothetical protein
MTIVQCGQQQSAASLRARLLKPVIAGLAGTLVHLRFMYLKSRLGLLPSFQPYQSLQASLFGRINSGAMKGLAFGLIEWAFMGLIFFPLIGIGPRAAYARLGVAPAVMSLAMVLTYVCTRCVGVFKACFSPVRSGTGSGASIATVTSPLFFTAVINSRLLWLAVPSQGSVGRLLAWRRDEDGAAFT